MAAPSNKTWENALVSPAHLALAVAPHFWQPAAHLLHINRVLVDFLMSPGTEVLIVSVPVRHGKELRCDEPILTPLGWRRFGDLAIGDEVFGGDGHPTQVLATSEVNHDAEKVRVMFSDGTSLVVHPGHEWTLWSTASKQWRTIDTRTLMQLPLEVAQKPVWQLPARRELRSDSIETPFDPWTFGYVVAGGDLDAAEAVALADPAVVAVARDIRAAGTIPDVLLGAGTSQRMALLQGLVDAAGGASSRLGAFLDISAPLVDVARTLIRSLGSDPRSTEPHRLAWHPRDMGSHGCTPVGRFVRNRQVRRIDPDGPFVVGIVPAPRADGVCIQVANDDGLFVAGRDCIVTHNSELLSVWTPAWFLSLWPDKEVMLATYSGLLATDWGRKVRNIITEFGPSTFGVTVASDSAAVSRFHIQGHQGGMYAVGIDGTITGRGGDVLIIDDPFSGPEDANNPVVRDQVWNTYREKLRTRLKANAKIIVIMSRWHNDDLAGRLKAGLGGDPIRMVELPALAEPDPAEAKAIELIAAENPGTANAIMAEWSENWRDSLGRKVGDALWPQMYPVAALEQTRNAVGRTSFMANYQQRPVTREGEMFKREWWKYVDIAPAGMRLIRRWDKAGTAGAGDWTAGVLMGRDDEGFIYVLDVRRIQGSPLQVESFIAATAELDREKYGRRVKIRLEQEPGSSGKSVAERYIREVLAGYAVSAKPSTGSKELRAEPFAAQCEGGNVFLVRRPGDSGFHAQKWWEMFIDEAAEFPRGSNDDMIDAASQAFNDLVGKKAHGRASTAAGQHITPAQDGGRLYIVGSA